MQTLVLDQSLQPINIVSWHRAVGMMLTGSADVLEEYDQLVHPRMQMPAVVRLHRPIERHKQKVKFSRANVVLRDRNRCQYCGRQFPTKELTFDHVIPRSRGGKTVWENIVMACWPCNDAKRNRLPHEADMRLLRQPVRPSWVPHYNPRLKQSEVPPEWRNYWHVELEP
jgi:5-methylcytosine-specific restriction endonuclease McrA